MSKDKAVAMVTVVESTGIRLPSDFDQKVARIVATHIYCSGRKPQPDEVMMGRSNPLSQSNDPAPDVLGIAIFAPHFEATECHLASVAEQIAAVIMNDCFRGKQKVKARFLTEEQISAAKKQAA